MLESLKNYREIAMQESNCEQELQNLRHEIRTLLHDTLAQTLFSASTISGVIHHDLQENETSHTELMLELDNLLKEAVIELKSIQMVLSNDD